jgi:hypothetical protein
MFAGSDSGGEHAAVLYSLIGTCRLNNVEPEKWLRYVIEHIQDWPANRVRDLLPWKVDLTAQYQYGSGEPLTMNPVPWLQMTNMISYQGLVRTFLSNPMNLL